jgi:DNA-directed RNA polymerase subunit RPC12/RpoP
MEGNTQVSTENISRFPCNSCGASMAFDAESYGLRCDYCGSVELVEVTGSVEEKCYIEFSKAGASQLTRLAAEALQVSCESCGAVVQFTPPETARECCFCGVKIVTQPKAADPLVAPHGALPFSVPDQLAKVRFKAWLGSLWFAPTKLQQLAESDKLISIYIPYWTYDALTDSSYRGERGEYYTEWETYYENGESKSRTVTKTRWRPVSGRVSRFFDDVCVPGTTSIRHDYLQRLEPWDLNLLKPYEPAYLAGHKAEAYRIPVDAGFEKFKNIAYRQIQNDCRRDIGGDRQRIHSIDTHYSNVTFKHILLPVYSGAYRFSGKTYQIVINGRTGAVHGGRPFSLVKIGLFAAFILLLILIVFAVFSSS